MRKFLFLLTVTLATSTCAHIPGIALPAGVINCGLKRISDLVVSIIDDANTCLGAGKQAGCDQAQPSDVTQTRCSWKRCLWDTARPQGVAYGTEALLCAVEQSGIDFGAAADVTGDPAPREAQKRAQEFLRETNAQFAHQAPASK